MVLKAEVLRLEVEASSASADLPTRTGAKLDTVATLATSRCCRRMDAGQARGAAARPLLECRALRAGADVLAPVADCICLLKLRGRCLCANKRWARAQEDVYSCGVVGKWIVGDKVQLRSSHSKCFFDSRPPSPFSRRSSCRWPRIHCGSAPWARRARPVRQTALRAVQQRARVLCCRLLTWLVS